MSEEFNPAERVIKIQGGAAYLQVKDRMLWARHEHPDLCVETEVVRLDDKIAVFKARVSFWDEASALMVVGSGHGSETPQGFPPGFIEKAETVALGRALATIGYGTAAAFEEEPGSKLADAPVLPHGHASPQETRIRERGEQMRQERPPVAVNAGLISPRQQGFIRTLMRDHGVSDELMHTMILVDYQKDHLGDLTKQDASAFIERLQGLPLADEQGVTQEPQKGYEVNQQGYDVPDEPEWMRAGQSAHFA